MPLSIDSIESAIGAPVGAPRRHVVRIGFDIGVFSASQRPVAAPFWQAGDVPPATADQANTPVAFQLVNGNRGIPLTVRGHNDFTASPAWAGIRFRLTGTFGVVSIQSEFTAWAGVDGAFVATNFTFAPGMFLNYPFRAAGNWVWTITAENGNAALTAIAGIQPRIEMYVLVGDPDPIFNNVLWAELLRLAVPPYAAGAGLNQGVQQTQTTYMAWIADKLWNFATPSEIRYDCRNGRPHFGPTSQGGNFELANFLGPSYVSLGALSFPWRAWRICNCYDLAGFVAIAFKALGMRTDNVTPVLRPDWRYRKPFGYVTQGPLFGWPQYQNLNSPFWKQAWYWPDSPQFFANPLDPNRTRFANHAFIAVRFLAPPPGTSQIVDVCKALIGPPVVLADGAQTYAAYMAAGTEVGARAVVNPQLFINLPGITTIV